MLKSAFTLLGSATLAVCAARATSTLTVHAANPGNNTVAPTMFGTNVVYNRTSPANWGTFIATMNSLGMTALRYPGGTVTEEYFDFRASNVAGAKTDCITLTMFLQAVETNGFTPLLVVPVKNFDTNADAARYAGDFVRAVNIDHGIAGGEQFGTTQRVTRWELGNEYYSSSGRPAMTRTSYGQRANACAHSMIAVDGTVMPTVQFRRDDWSNADEIATELKDNVVKACLTHVYPWPSPSYSDVETQLTGGQAKFGGLPLFVTEWNLGNDNATGMVQANYLPQVFVALVNAGVKIATEWPLMGDADAGPSNLAQSNGTLRPAGQVFKWLSETAKGRHIVPVDSVSSEVRAVAFKSGGNMTVLVLCGDAQTDSSVSIQIMGFNGDQFHVDYAARYSAAGGDVSSIAPAVKTTPLPGKDGNVLTIKANHNSHYEVIRLDLINTPQ